MVKGKKPSVKHLHVFGCKCFVLRTHPEQLGKFDTKVDEGIFVGYPPGRAYKVFNLRTRKVIESINVSFDDGKITGMNEDDHERFFFLETKILSQMLMTQILMSQLLMTQLLMSYMLMS